MAQIAYILLCHTSPEAVIAQAERLTAAGDCIAIHLDARAGTRTHARIAAALTGNPRVTFPARRVRCGWGDWSLVRATIATLEAALGAFPGATHFHLLSGDCMPIKSARHIRAFLDDAEADIIESVDFFGSEWIRTGMKDDRLHLRHVFNERRHKRLFYASCELQRRLRLQRRIPGDLRVMIGSQWWCLRRGTVESVLEFARRQRDVVRFFRTTWIPDETFFQTLVRHLVPREEIRSRTPTFLIFSDYGMPVTFHNDHHDLLLRQDFLFARKVSPEATTLRGRLGALYLSEETAFPITGEGRRLYGYLTGRGRVGHRFAPRSWEAGASLGRSRELLIVTCRKWHLARRVAARIETVTGIPELGFPFDDDAARLPDLGGIQTTRVKRSRHRRALMRMLFEYHGTDRLIVCLDPGAIELMRDFHEDRATMRLLEIACSFSDGDLKDRARQLGLANARTPPAALDALLPTIRNDLACESDRLRDAGFPGFHRLLESDTLPARTAALAGFLDIQPAKAHQVAATPNLFAD